MDIKDLELRPRTLQAVQFTEESSSDVKTWVQDKLPFQQVTATDKRLYLPTAEGMDILECSDWVLYDPVDNTFRGATDDAIQTHYQEVVKEEEL